jgi:hypothetical protein
MEHIYKVFCSCQKQEAKGNYRGAKLKAEMEACHSVLPSAVYFNFHKIF